MESMSHDPAAGEIGSRLIEIASRGMDSVSSAMTSLTGLTPAGGEEVSMQAAMAFAAQGASMQASNTAAQEEIARTGVALMDIARRYSQVDGAAAGSLVSSNSQLAEDPFVGGPAASAGSGLMRAATAPDLMRAATAPDAGGSAVRTPPLAQPIQAPAPSNPSTLIPAAAGAASSVIGTGVSSLSSLGQSAATGGTGGPALASSPGQDKEESDADNSGDSPPGERLL